MAKLQTVLIAIDDDTAEPHALSTGLALARKQGARVLVYGVVRQADNWASTLADIMPKDELRQRFVEQRRQQLQQRLDQLDYDDLDVTIEVTEGVPFIETIRKAITENAQLIVQSSHPRPEDKVFFSSADWHLMRKSPVPVLVVKDDRYPQWQRLMVSLDVMSNEPDTEEFNQHLLRMAANMASAVDAKLHVFTAWQLHGEEMLENSGFIRISKEEISELRDKQATEVLKRQERLREWLKTQQLIADDQVQWHLEKANPREAIADFADDHQVDLVVMGTVGRTGIPGFLIGNTAESVLSGLHCSVLTMKPPRFSSPVVA